MNRVSLDATVLTSLQGCARLVENRFIDLWTPSGGKSNSMEVGSIAHVVLQYYALAAIEGKSRSDAIEAGFIEGQKFISGCNDCKSFASGMSVTPCPIADHKGEWIGVRNTPELSDKKNIGWRYALDTMHQYFDYWRDDNYIYLGVEDTRGALIYEDSDLSIIWKAKFDAIIEESSGIISQDHKTMKQRRDNLSLNNQFMGQCLLLKTRQIMINKIGWQSSLKPEEKFVRARIPYSVDRLTEWATEIVPYYARMLVAYNAAGYFPPNFTHCETKYGFCDFKEICELDRGLRQEAFKINFVKGRKWDV